MDFITIKNKIVRKEDIKNITVEKDVEQTCDYDYPNGLRPTNIYMKIEFIGADDWDLKIDDDDYDIFLGFVKDFYDLTTYDEYTKKAAELVHYADIREVEPSADDDYSW